MFGIPQCLLKFSALIFCPSNPYSSVHGMCHPCCGAPDDGSNRSSLIFQDVCFKLPIYPMLPLITSMDAILHLVKSSSLLSDVHHVPFLSVNGHTVFLHGKGFATKICWRLRCGNTQSSNISTCRMTVETVVMIYLSRSKMTQYHPKNSPSRMGWDVVVLWMTRKIVNIRYTRFRL